MARNMVNKAFVKELISTANLNGSEAEVHAICESMMTLIIEKVKKGETVSFTNFLKFQRTVNKERTFKNPKSDTQTTKPARYGISVKVMPATRLALEQIPMESEEPEKEPVNEISEEEEEKPKQKKVVPKEKKAEKKPEISEGEISEEEEKPKVPKEKKAVKPKVPKEKKEKKSEPEIELKIELDSESEADNKIRFTFESDSE